MISVNDVNIFYNMFLNSIFDLSRPIGVALKQIGVQVFLTEVENEIETDRVEQLFDKCWISSRPNIIISRKINMKSVDAYNTMCKTISLKWVKDYIEGRVSDQKMFDEYNDLYLNYYELMDFQLKGFSNPRVEIVLVNDNNGKDEYSHIIKKIKEVFNINDKSINVNDIDLFDNGEKEKTLDLQECTHIFIQVKLFDICVLFVFKGI